MTFEDDLEASYMWPPPVVCAQCGHDLHMCLRYQCVCDREGRPT